MASTWNPFVTAFACAAVAFAVGVSVAQGLFNPQLGSTTQASEMMGRLFGIVAIPALIAGFLARRSAMPRSIGRIIVTYVATLIVVVAMYALSATQSFTQTGTKNASLKAKNASKDIMLSVDDYLRLLPKSELMERVREATKANDAVNHFSESWPTPTGNYSLFYLHRSRGAVVMCHLVVAADDAQATKAADDLFRGGIAGMKEKQEITLSLRQIEAEAASQ